MPRTGLLARSSCNRVIVRMLLRPYGVSELFGIQEQALDAARIRGRHTPSNLPGITVYRERDSVLPLLLFMEHLVLRG